MICFADQYGCEIISSPTAVLPYIESVALKITHKNEILVASTVYRQPNSNFDLFHSFVESNFPARRYSTSDRIICGDFNLNLLNVHELQKYASMFYSDIKTKMLIPSISRPTRVASSSCTLIDNPRNHLG